MDIPTKNLSKYVKEKGINLSKMSRDTGIPYMALYDSLMNDSRDRDLRAGEFFVAWRVFGNKTEKFCYRTERKKK